MEPFYMKPQLSFTTTADRVRALERLEAAMGGESLSSLMAHKFLSLFSAEDIRGQLKVCVLCVLWCRMMTRVLCGPLTDRCRAVFHRPQCGWPHRPA